MILFPFRKNFPLLSDTCRWAESCAARLPFDRKSTCHWEWEQWESNVNLPLSPSRSGELPSPAPPPSGHERSYCFWPGLDKPAVLFLSEHLKNFHCCPRKPDLCCVCGCTDSWIIMTVKSNLAGRLARILLRIFLNASQISYINAGHTMSTPTAPLCSEISDSRPPQPVGRPAWLHLSPPLLPSFSLYKVPDALRLVLTTGHDSLWEGRSSSHLLVSRVTRLRNSFGPSM